MLLPIYLYGHPVLRATAEPLTAEDNNDELSSLIADMWAGSCCAMW